MTPTRRSVCASMAFAVAFGLDRTLALFPEASAQTMSAPSIPYRSWKFGDMECINVYDGVWERPLTPNLAENASLDDVKAALAKAKLPVDFLPLPFNVLVVRNAGKTYMFDAGTGGQVQPTAGSLHTNMKAAGIDPGKIDAIFVSHLHPDHIFGLMTKDDQPVYPNAELVLAAREFRFWTDESTVSKLPAARKPLAARISRTLAKWKNVRLVEGEPEVANGVRLLEAPGHTPGHAAYHLASGNEQLIVSGDTAYLPAISAAHPSWRTAFDQDPQLAGISRRKIIDRAIADNVMVAGYHFPFPGAGRFSRDGDGYALSVAG